MASFVSYVLFEDRNHRAAIETETMETETMETETIETETIETEIIETETIETETIETETIVQRSLGRKEKRIRPSSQTTREKENCCERRWQLCARYRSPGCNNEASLTEVRCNAIRLPAGVATQLLLRRICAHLCARNNCYFRFLFFLSETTIWGGRTNSISAAC
ncbi:hypothetical protein MRX96_006402 [Rhipicephalus microplus]